MSSLEPRATPSIYTEADVQAVREAFYRSCPDCDGSGQVLDMAASMRAGQPEPMQCERCGYLNAGLNPAPDGEAAVARAILDTVGPLLAAKALRDFAAMFMGETPGLLLDAATCRDLDLLAQERASDIEAGVR